MNKEIRVIDLYYWTTPNGHKIILCLEEMHLAYQPVISLVDDRIIGYEALIRWDHPIHGRMPPEVFVSVAEDRGLIELLTAKVLNETS